MALVARAVLEGVAVGTSRGVLLGLWQDKKIYVCAVLGEKQFISELMTVWRDLWPTTKVSGDRHGRLRHYSLDMTQKYGFTYN